MKRKKNNPFVLVFILCIIVTLVNCNSPKDELYELIPGDADGILIVNFKTLTQSELYQHLLAIKEMGRETAFMKKAERNLKESNINLESDLSKFCFMVFMPDSGSEKISAVFKIKYNKDRVMNAIKKDNNSAYELSYNDIPLIKTNDNTEPGEDSLVGFLNPSTIVLGDETQVKKIIDLQTGKTGNILSNKKMIKLLDTSDNDTILTMAFIFPDKLRKTLKPLTQFSLDTREIESMRFTLYKKSAFLGVASPDDKTKERIAAVLNGYKSMISLFKNNFDAESQALDVSEHVSVETGKHEVRMTLSIKGLLLALKTMVYSGKISGR